MNVQFQFTRPRWFWLFVADKLMPGLRESAQRYSWARSTKEWLGGVVSVTMQIDRRDPEDKH